MTMWICRLPSSSAPLVLMNLFLCPLSISMGGPVAPKCAQTMEWGIEGGSICYIVCCNWICYNWTDTLSATIESTQSAKKTATQLASSGVRHMVVWYRDGIMYQPHQVSTSSQWTMSCRSSSYTARFLECSKNQKYQGLSCHHHHCQRGCRNFLIKQW